MIIDLSFLKITIKNLYFTTQSQRQTSSRFSFSLANSTFEIGSASLALLCFAVTAAAAATAAV